MAFTDTMLKSLLAGLGVKPDDIINGLQFVLAETNAMRNDREAYKAGVQAFLPIVTQHMAETSARFDRLEILMLDIQSRLPARAVEHDEAPKLLNGAKHDG